MRTRTTTTGSYTNVYRYRQLYQSCNNVPNGSVGTIGTFLEGSVTVKTISDVEVPGFQALKKCFPKRVLPFNPMTVTTVKTTRQPGNTDVTVRRINCGGSPPPEGMLQQHDWGREWIVPSVPWTIAAHSVPEATIKSVVNGAIADARSAHWDALTFLAEAKELGNLYRTTITRVTVLVRSIREKALRILKNYKGKKTYLEILDGLWLEYRYAWTPLFYSLEDAIRTFKHGSKSGTVRGRAAQSLSQSDQASGSYLIDANRATVRWNETLTVRHTVRGWALANHTGLLTAGFDPLVTAYELTRLSFVLDWFIQIGTWITAISPLQPGDSLVSGYSIKTTQTRVYNSYVAWDQPDYGSIKVRGSGPAGTISEEITSYTRGPYGASLPGWNPEINLKRVVDAFALIEVLSRSMRR